MKRIVDDNAAAIAPGCTACVGLPERFGATALLVLSVLLCSACGNKGPLFLELDQDTLRELEELSREIETVDDEAEEEREKQPVKNVSPAAADE